MSFKEAFDWLPEDVRRWLLPVACVAALGLEASRVSTLEARVAANEAKVDRIETRILEMHRDQLAFARDIYNAFGQTRKAAESQAKVDKIQKELNPNAEATP